MSFGQASWYVAQTKPRQERTAYDNLLRQGYCAYLPHLKVLRRIRRCQQARLEPMFPRYLFFRPGSEKQSIGPVRSTFGVQSIVSFGHAPALLLADAVESIRALESRQNAASMDELSPINPGASVLVVDGPFAGLEGMVSSVSARRIDVLMQLLGTAAKVSLDRNSLEVIG
jgi:transcriptional antiterminator RfaH